jgi:ABC-2 type transport system permease protein
MGTSRLYVRLVGAHLRATLEYERDFWILAIATVLTQLANIVFLTALFAKVPRLNGWAFWSVVMMFGLFAVAEGVSTFCFEGMWRLAGLINTGELDYFLVRPYPVVLQASSADVGVNGLSNLVIGCLMIGVGAAHVDIAWSPWRVALAVLLVVSAIVIRVAINLAANSASFWLNSPTSLFASAVARAGELGRFPLSIYPLVPKAILSFVIPFGFTSFFPIAYLTDTGPSRWVGLLTPLVGGYCVAVALLVFRRGLRRYESAGN